MLRILMMAAVLSIINVIAAPSVEATNVDDELSIMAAEQRKENDADVTVSDEIETFDNRPNQPAKTQPTDNKPVQPIQEEPQPEPQQQDQSLPPSSSDSPRQSTLESSESPVSQSLEIRASNQQSPITNYDNFAEASKKVGFIPLYVPRKSGYAMNNISVINNNIIELRYGRRWEPTVTLAIRTYKRAAGEQVKDISGISGVKWKVDMSSGMTLYIARISDNSSVAAWSVGQYTFAAMTENLSFAAFHALIVEELVDLCNHYFIDLN